MDRPATSYKNKKPKSSKNKRTEILKNSAETRVWPSFLFFGISVYVCGLHGFFLEDVLVSALFLSLMSPRLLLWFSGLLLNRLLGFGGAGLLLGCCVCALALGLACGWFRFVVLVGLLLWG